MNFHQMIFNLIKMMLKQGIDSKIDYYMEGPENFNSRIYNLYNVKYLKVFQVFLF